MPPTCPYPHHLETTLQYHTDLMHWMAEGLSHLHHIQGVSLAPRPIFPPTTTAAPTEEFYEDDDPLDDATIAPDDPAPMDD